MGYSSQSGQVLMRTQDSAGIFPVDFGTTSIAMKIKSGSLGPNRDLLVPDMEIGGGRDVSEAYLGAASWSGDFEFYARLESISTLIQACLGVPAVTAPEGTAGAWTHDFSPSDNATLPYIAVEERIGSGLEVYQYTDAVVNSFHMEAEANGFLMGTAGLIAKKQIAGAAATATPDFDESPLLVGTNTQVTLGGISLPAKSFGFDINNNFEDDDFRLGSFYLGDLTAKGREVMGNVAIRPEDSALWRRAVYGQSGLTEVGGLTTKSPLVVTSTTYEDIDGSTPIVKSSIKVTFPKIVLEPFALEPSGDDIIENDISWRAIRNQVGTPICTVLITSGMETVA